VHNYASVNFKRNGTTLFIFITRIISLPWEGFDWRVGLDLLTLRWAALMVAFEGRVEL
jgi:hypothetical protein